MRIWFDEQDSVCVFVAARYGQPPQQVEAEPLYAV